MKWKNFIKIISLILLMIFCLLVYSSIGVTHPPLLPRRHVGLLVRAAAPRVWNQDRSSVTEFQSPEEQRPEIQRTRRMTGMRLPQYNPKPYVEVTDAWGKIVPVTATRVDCAAVPGPAHQKTRRTLGVVPLVRLT